MKVITKAVFDMRSGLLLQEESYQYSGPIALCGGSGGGGGQSGTVNWPDWYAATHAHMMAGYDGSDPLSDPEFPGSSAMPDTLTSSLFDVMDVALGASGNPYASVVSFDPDEAFTPTSNSPLDKMADAQDAANTSAGAIAPTTDWGSYVTAAAAKVSSLSDIDFLDSLSASITGLLTAVNTVLDGSYIDTASDQFEASMTIKFKRRIAEFAAGMADVNAVAFSSFVVGMAIMESEFGRDIASFEANLRQQLYSDLVRESISNYLKAQVVRVQNSDTLVINGAQQIADLKKLRESLVAQLAQMKIEVERLTLIALKEQTDSQIDIDALEYKWDLEVYQVGANVFSSISGSASYIPPQPSKASSALAGALGGAGAGAAFGPIGAGVGAAIGLGLGLLG